MDIIRDTKPQKKKKRIIWGTVAVVVVGALFLGMQALPTAAPTVERASIWTDTVQRGDMVRMVRGPGTLVPEQARWITAVTNGRIEQIVLLSGSQVQPGDTLMVMSNPDVEVQLLTAQQQLSQAQANLTQLRSALETQRLTQEGTMAQIQTQYLEARRAHELNQTLYETNPDLVPQADLDRSREQMEELRTRLDLQEETVRIARESGQDQIEAQMDQVRRLQELVEFQQTRLESLVVRTTVGGVLAPLQTPLEEGQWVQSGQQLGRVVEPSRLKAEIRIPQTQAREIVVGQEAYIDTRSDTIQGHVSRIDPAVRQGTVTIDVTLPAELPSSARPDLSVDGNVVIEQLDDVIHVSRPSYGQANSSVSLFRLTEDGEYAERVTVRLGASSVNDIEVIDGLQPGNIVILSDMSSVDGFDRVRIR